MKLHPAYKEAAKEIAESEKDFFSWDEIAAMLDTPKDTIQFQIQRMQLKSHALDEFEIDLIATANEHKGRGYKKATDEEKVVVTAPRLDRRIRNATRKQRKVLTTVEPSLLSEKILAKFNRHIVKNGLMIAFLHKARLSKCLPGVTVDIGTPRLIEK